MSIDSETAEALLAGFIAGAAAAIAVSAVVLVAMSHSAAWRARAAARTIAPVPVVGAFIANVLLLGCTALGLLLGAAYLRAESERPDGALGSGNWLFSVLVAGAAALALGVAGFVRGRVTWPMTAASLVGAACYGWLLPVLAR